jgi:zinc transport system substrate-binding protein
MKKIIITILLLFILSGFFAGCINNPKTKNNTENITIVATIFPPYDFAKQICGGAAEVEMLLPPGAESHSYEPSAQDIIKIQNCDLFIYVGGESDTWVDNILSSLDKPIKTVKMMDYINIVEEEAIYGIKTHHDEAAETKSKNHEKEYDEHVWTSPRNAVLITQAITDAICEIDTKNVDLYRQNSLNYIIQLEELDSQFADFFDAVTNKTLIFGDRFPLRYFVDEYNLTYYAAFPGCSNETEASAATIAFLIDKVKEEHISTIFYIEFSNHKIADSIAEATNTKTALFHTCHNVSKEELENGATYLSLMKQNLATLKECMN